MKVTIPSPLLREALSRVIRVVARTTTMPVLSTVLVSAKGDKLTLTATDMEVSITTSVAATVTEEGEISLPGRKFSDVVAKLPSADVSLETQENEATTLSCGQARFKLVGMKATDFPREADFQEDRRFTVVAQVFGRTLRKISYAISQDQSRYVLAGVLLNVTQGQLTLVATDGRRLALVERPLEDGAGVSDGEWILPQKLVNELGALLSKEVPLQIRLADARASFQVGDTIIASKLVDGRYPNFRQVIPGNFSNQVVISRSRFAEVLDRVGVVVAGTANSVRMNLTSGQIELSANSPDFGESTEPFEVSYEGAGVRIAFNPDFLRQPLSELENDQVTLKFNDEFKPVLLLGDEGFLYVIMPMRS